MPRIARIRVALLDVEPAIWRRIEVPLNASLFGLHDAIQVAMLFQSYHLFLFQTGGKSYGIPDPDGPDAFGTLHANSVKLAQLIARGVAKLSYEYDFGDQWKFSVAIEAVAEEGPGVLHPRFVEGARRAPPEDIGGIYGFMDFIEAMAKPHHKKHQRLFEWYGGPFDSGDIGKPDIEARMARLAPRRAVGMAGFLKSQASRHR